MQPIISVNKFESHQLFLCLNFLTMSGSAKETYISYALDEMEKKNQLDSIHTFIEYSTGESSIALSLKAKQLNKRCIVVLPCSVNNRIVEILLQLDVEVIICDTLADSGSGRSFIHIAERIAEYLPNSCLINHYFDSHNPLSNYLLASKKFASINSPIDILVCPVESGGTISGFSRFLKEKNSQLKVIGVESEGSVLSSMGVKNSNGYPMPGLGCSIIPSTLDYSLISDWVSFKKMDILDSHRELLTQYGLLGGYSSAASLLAVKALVKNDRKKCNILAILPDAYRGNAMLPFNEAQKTTKYPFVFTKHGLLSLSKYFL